MPNIEVDFEVFKHITFLRENEDMDENDVLRKLLNLSPLTKISSEELIYNQTHATEAKKSGGIWETNNVIFPAGTLFRANYKGKKYSGIIKNNGFYVNEKRYVSLSAAASAITSTNVNGWRFWEVLRPDDKDWKVARFLMARPVIRIKRMSSK